MQGKYPVGLSTTLHCFVHTQNLVGLRSFISLHDVKFDIVALFQALIAISTNRAVVHENIWPIVPANESESLRIIEPLHFSFELSHEEALPSIQIGIARIP